MSPAESLVALRRMLESFESERVALNGWRAHAGDALMSRYIVQVRDAIARAEERVWAVEAQANALAGGAA